MRQDEECLGCCSVHKGTIAVAIFTVIVSIIAGLTAHEIGRTIVGVSVLASCLMVYGLQRRIPNLYIPYLLLGAIAFIAQFILLIMSFYHPDTHKLRMRKHGASTIVASLIIYLVVIIPITYFFLVIPYKSYRLLKWRLENGNVSMTNPVQNIPLTEHVRLDRDGHFNSTRFQADPFSFTPKSASISSIPHDFSP